METVNSALYFWPKCLGERKFLVGCYRGSYYKCHNKYCCDINNNFTVDFWALPAAVPTQLDLLAVNGQLLQGMEGQL